MASMDHSHDCKINRNDLLLDSFNIVSSECSLPSLGSNDESFVVLWKDGDNKSSKEIDPESASSKSVEAKSLLKKLPMEIEQLSFANEVKLEPSNNLSDDDNLSIQNENKDADSVQMGQSLQLPNMPQINNDIDTSDIISIPTLTDHLTPEEIEKKVSEIVEENIRLKDTILGNNSTMKLQYERIVKWQSDVQKVHQTHREKIIEAKDFIEKLKKENSNLYQELEELKESKRNQEEEINILKQALKEKEQLTQETDNERRDVNELERKMKNAAVENAVLTEYKTKLICANNKTEEYEKEVVKLQTALQSSKKEFEEAKIQLNNMQVLHEDKLKSFNETIHSLSSQLVATNQQQETTNIQNQLDSTQVALNEVICSGAEAYAQIDNLNKEIVELKMKLEVSQAQADEIFALKAQLELNKADFDTEKSAKEAFKVEKEKFAGDIQNLQKQNQQLREKINSIRDNYYVIPRSQGQESTPSKQSTSDDPCFLQ